MLRTVLAELPELVVPDACAWSEWLSEHHDESPGVWLVLAKKGTSEPTSLTYEQALEEALCQGWIDGQVGRRDDATYRQRFTQRRRRSAWSQRNRWPQVRALSNGADTGQKRPGVGSTLPQGDGATSRPSSALAWFCMSVVGLVEPK